VRDLLVQASERLAEASPSEVMRLLRLPESEALMGTVELCGRLELQGSVAGLTETLAHQDRTVRLATVRSLTAIGSPGALQSLEKALDDQDREIRIFAVRALGTRGYKNALKRIEHGVLEGGLKDADLTERIAFFEAYALIARNAALDPLTRVLIPGGMFRKKHGPESRACAAIALARLGTADARAVLQLAREDKDLVVRNAVNRALRESTGTRVPPE
jgi:HEAT repeat protein